MYVSGPGGLTNTGKALDNWTINEDDSSTAYNVGGVLTVNADIEFFVFGTVIKALEDEITKDTAETAQ